MSSEDSQIRNNKSILREKINNLSHRDRIIMLNDAISKMGSTTKFFGYDKGDKPNPHVERAAQEMLDNWMEVRFEVLNEAYAGMMKNKQDDDDYSSQDSYEIGDQWVNGKLMIGEVDTDDEE